MTAAPIAHQILIEDPGSLGTWEGDLCDLGALSFKVEAAGPSMLEIGAGGQPLTATVNVLSNAELAPGLDLAPFGTETTGGLHIVPGAFLQIIATTTFTGAFYGVDRDQQMFFGRVTSVKAVQPRKELPYPRGWERTWQIEATNLAVDLGEHGLLTGNLAFSPTNIQGRIEDILDKSGSWWPLVPCYDDTEGASTLRLSGLYVISAGDEKSTVTAELERTAQSLWCWYSWVHNPWRFGYSTAYRAAVRVVHRESPWRLASTLTSSRWRFRSALIGDPWITDFPPGTYDDGYYSVPGLWSFQIDIGMGAEVSNDNYLYEVTVNPYSLTLPKTVTGDDMFGSRTASFMDHVGACPGHLESETPGSPPSGGGGASWQIATSWADGTSVEALRFTVTWRLHPDAQDWNGDLLDVDRLDGMWIVWDGAVRYLRVRSWTLTAAPGDWRVTCVLERVVWAQTTDIPLTPP